MESSVDIYHLLSEKQYRQSDWQHLLSLKNEHHCFLYTIYPLLEYTQQTFAKKLALLQQLQHNIDLSSLISRDFARIIHPTIIQPFAVELYSAAQRGMLQGNTPEERFNFFVNALSEPENIHAVFQKYQPLTKLLNSVIFQYINSTFEALERLAQDWDFIQQQFFPNNEEITLTDVIACGDRHHQGRSVLKLQFEENQKKPLTLMYKPRALGIDIAIQTFLTWFNTHSDFDFLIQHIENREDYAWVGFIEQTPCQSEQEVKQFYYRFGGWLAIADFLSARDLHYENVIAHGSQPVIIDFECFCTPSMETIHHHTGKHTIDDIGILPMIIKLSDDDKGVDLSALGAVETEYPAYQVVSWENVATDQMKVKRKPVTIGKGQHRPTLNGKPLDYRDYLADFNRGFEEAKNIIQNKDDFLLNHPDSPLNELENRKVRVLYRPTVYYGKLLQESYHPLLLHNPEERKKHFELLKKDVNVEKFGEIIQEELEDLTRNNIPCFYVRTKKKR